MTVYGWDMSHYDNPSLGPAVAEGISFNTHKAGGDSSSGDQELDDWWRTAKLLNPKTVLLGAYWVPRPDLYSSPSGEADRFLAKLDAVCAGWRDRDAFILQVDAEEWNQDPATKPSLSYLKAFCNRLVYRAPDYRPIVYASAGQYGSSLSGLGYPLWNARYPYSVAEGFKAAYARAGGDSGKGWGSYSGQVPVIWQYTSSATIGGQSTSDANAFRGTLQQLKDLVTPVANLSTEDKAWISAEIAKVADQVWSTKIGNVKYPNRTAIRALNDLSTERDGLVDPKVSLEEAGIVPGTPLAQIIDAADAILAPDEPTA
jgi:GH25 family lysozyme M1 (1,4-beta-N-acetylmuramidase)